MGGRCTCGEGERDEGSRSYASGVGAANAAGGVAARAASSAAAFRLFVSVDPLAASFTPTLAYRSELPKKLVTADLMNNLLSLRSHPNFVSTAVLI